METHERRSGLRWTLAIAAALLAAMLVYLGSAALALSDLVRAARAGNGAAILARTNMPALTRSVTDQIVDAYLRRIGETRRIGAAERMIVTTYGASVADAMVTKLLTADNLSAVLRHGNIREPSGTALVEGVPALADLKTGNPLVLLNRLKIVKPVLLEMRISRSSSRDDYAAVALHFESGGWKLSGLTLPQTALQKLAAALPAR